MPAPLGQFSTGTEAGRPARLPRGRARFSPSRVEGSVVRAASDLPTSLPASHDKSAPLQIVNNSLRRSPKKTGTCSGARSRCLLSESGCCSSVGRKTAMCSRAQARALPFRPTDWTRRIPSTFCARQWSRAGDTQSLSLLVLGAPGPSGRHPVVGIKRDCLWFRTGRPPRFRRLVVGRRFRPSGFKLRGPHGRGSAGLGNVVGRGCGPFGRVLYE